MNPAALLFRHIALMEGGALGEFIDERRIYAAEKRGAERGFVEGFEKVAKVLPVDIEGEGEGVQRSECVADM